MLLVLMIFNDLAVLFLLISWSSTLRIPVHHTSPLWLPCCRARHSHDFSDLQVQTLIGLFFMKLFNPRSVACYLMKDYKSKTVWFF